MSRSVPDRAALPPERRALLRLGEKTVRRLSATFAALFPMLHREDIAAIATWELHRAAGAYEGEGLFLPYLRRRIRWAVLRFVEKELPLARHVFPSVWRAAVRRGDHVDTDEEDVDALSDGEGEDAILAQLDRARALAALGCALAMLSVEDRAVLLWKCRDGATNESIAAALGVSEGTAKRKVAAARSAVRCALRERGIATSGTGER
jgi:RNA polymerase sigma factor (sigma-70 family)